MAELKLLERKNMEESFIREQDHPPVLTSLEESSEEGVLAAIFYEAKRPLEFCLLPRPELQPGEVLARVVCCTLCGSDLHTIAGRRKELSPSILGHEILGVVEEVSDEPAVDVHGDPLKPGDRITWSICVSCGRCDRCLRGLPQKCRHLHKYDLLSARDRTRPDKLSVACCSLLSIVGTGTFHNHRRCIPSTSARRSHRQALSFRLLLKAG